MSRLGELFLLLKSEELTSLSLIKTICANILDKFIRIRTLKLNKCVREFDDDITVTINSYVQDLLNCFNFFINLGDIITNLSDSSSKVILNAINSDLDILEEGIRVFLNNLNNFILDNTGDINNSTISFRDFNSASVVIDD